MLNIKAAFYISFTVVAVLLVIFLLNLKNPRVCMGSDCFNVNIAKDEISREKGLQYQEFLRLKSGMLFVFDNEGRHSFWMKNTLIPLDIVWIDKNRKIVEIKKDSQPCKSSDCSLYVPKSSARYVLEINSGESDKYNLRVGDELTFKDLDI